ncbi:hypothetical protein D5086_029365 [Populus alba]|uniref:Uncharacterized protein n=2 Tax=Populus TaxID=3689 RepID=A0ACC4ATI7_POPAL
MPPCYLSLCVCGPGPATHLVLYISRNERPCIGCFSDINATTDPPVFQILGVQPDFAAFMDSLSQKDYKAPSPIDSMTVYINSPRG